MSDLNEGPVQVFEFGGEVEHDGGDRSFVLRLTKTNLQGFCHVEVVGDKFVGRLTILNYTYSTRTVDVQAIMAKVIETMEDKLSNDGEDDS
jgi:hypothetical protein